MSEIFDEHGEFFGYLDEEGNLYNENGIFGYVKDGIVFKSDKYIGFINGFKIFHKEKEKEVEIKTTFKRGDECMPFGNYAINFSSVSNVTLGEVFGTGDMSPPEMTKKLWNFVKQNNLSKK